ncbi:NAD-P-binding protein [Stereum hirsutum FP-91666 SS1]|uniref:NAD-P-binding protein n=1 Tax=Stereum hirsutum (strain FP-91666) TaxID=721885 RepID=UPI000440CC37|nr:NAD-P-binding protein [Stereum hirsutum FP-91666 SS1]EIM89979.1 NAD-P-binding protein [Stereum hirsutum FP-91666 SS1]
MSVFNSSRLLGKTVLLTGASAGIGAATAILFARAGSNLILLARRTDALKTVAEAAAAAHKESGATQGGKIATIQFDVADKAQVASLFDKIPQDLRNIDILVNNAGFVHGVDKVGSIADADIEAMFATNVLGLISITQLLVRHFKERNAGHVINLGSVAGREPYQGGSIYCATKHAVRSFGTSLMKELYDTPIRVSEVQPGLVETEFSVVRFRGDKSAADKVYQGLDPLTPQDIAEEIVWVASRPPHVNIAELFVLPVSQASPTLVHRGN